MLAPAVSRALRSGSSRSVLTAMGARLRMQVCLQEGGDSGSGVTGGGLVVASAVEQPEGGEKHESPQVSCRILASWRDARPCRRNRSEGQGALCAAGAGAPGRVLVVDCCGCGRGPPTRVGQGDRAPLGGGGRDRQRPATGGEELAEIKELKAEVRRLEEDNEILRRASIFFAGGARPPQPLIVAFVEEMRAEGFAVESICRVLSEQGCQVAARTYRSWRQPSRRVAARTIGDVLVTDMVRDIAWTTDARGRRRLTPEGLYGRRR